jgi:pyruvate dehydrogenase E1 component alpha subunit
MRSEHDPIDQARRRLVGMGVAEDELRDTDRQVRARVAEAAQFAQESPEPDPSELWTDVLADA